MNNRAAQITAAVEELASELAHADALIGDQQARIDQLEHQVRILQSLLKAVEAA